ncbi:hypothetical protein [Microbispora sp. NPDC049633]|uniref:hypothetical protein n=1 Tax=Microbispora sp. NPDC049633 TaxID=3154355 RepID=UPI00343C36B1
MTWLWVVLAYVLGVVGGVLLLAAWIVYCVGDGELKIGHDDQGVLRVRWEEKP